MLNEEDGSGTLQSTYVHSSFGGSATSGRQIGTVLATSEGSTASSGTWRYYFQDAIGSTRGVWDEVAVRAGKYEYTPFGGKYADHGDDITRKFTGHDWDSEARLYYTAYRYYSPDSNRWLTRDPLGMVDGPNVYAYVMGNPVTMWDTLGRNAAVLTWAGGGGDFLTYLPRLAKFGRGMGPGGAAIAILVMWLAVELLLLELEYGITISLYDMPGWGKIECTVGRPSDPEMPRTPNPYTECDVACKKYSGGKWYACMAVCETMAFIRHIVGIVN